MLSILGEMGIMGKRALFPECFLLFLFLFFRIHSSKGSDSISPGQSLSGNQTLTSSGGIFELGFFTPGNSQKYYIGVWYKSLPDKPVMWVANRERPVSDPSSSAFKLFEDGNVMLLNQSTGAVIWSTNSTSKVSNSTIAKLLDSGNFVVTNAMELSGVIWQSFDHPTDHWIPGSKLGYNKLTNERQSLFSWTSPENPTPSLFSIAVEQNATNHLALWNGSQRYWDSGAWTGKIFTLVPEIQSNPYVTNITYVSNENETYCSYASAIPNTFTRFVLDYTGQYKQYVWRKNFKKWNILWTRPTQQCEVYGFCGPFGICNQQRETLCACAPGFEQKVPENWGLGDHRDGCVRRASLQCDGGKRDKFLVMPNMRFPENSQPLAATNVAECELACLSNCSCIAFAFDNRCLIWTGDLFNLQQLSSNEESGRDFRLRVSASQWTGTRVKGKRNTALIVAIVVSVLFLAIVLVILWRRRSAGLSEAVEDSLLLFKYRELRSATKNFSEKLGEGAFGSVFKGTLLNSTSIAVKELKCLKQGEKQFCAEVKTVGMIQHVNLIRLRGICVEASKRFLVYEFMPNGSLESVLFGNCPNVLEWQTRYKIAIGTARGLAYLHEECRDRIIHCDIKPENILLDAEYNPKVADFGLAKLFGRDFSRVLTTMRGTRGYLAPEWISGEAITTKADVFSYGMLLLEVISRRRNGGPFEEGSDDYFPYRVASTIHQGGNVIELIDERLEGEGIIEELTRACRVACWCIQDIEKCRPTMGEVVKVLEGVSEAGIPPIPQFLRDLGEDPAQGIDQETFSSES